jgi:hypothetical protein
MTAKEEQQNRELYQSNEIGSSHQDMGKPNILVPLATAVYFRGVVKILHVIHQPNYLALCTGASSTYHRQSKSSRIPTK